MHHGWIISLRTLSFFTCLPHFVNIWTHKAKVILGKTAGSPGQKNVGKPSQVQVVTAYFTIVCPSKLKCVCVQILNLDPWVCISSILCDEILSHTKNFRYMTKYDSSFEEKHLYNGLNWSWIDTISQNTIFTWKNDWRQTMVIQTWLPGRICSTVNRANLSLQGI